MTDIVERLRVSTTAYHSPTKELAVEAAAEILHLVIENWQLKGALGYMVPGHIPDNGKFKCGLCEAKTMELLELQAEIKRLRHRDIEGNSDEGDLTGET